MHPARRCDLHLEHLYQILGLKQTLGVLYLPSAKTAYVWKESQKSSV